MRDKKEFYNMLLDIADKPVSEYGRLAGDFDFSRYVLKVTQIPTENLNEPALFIVRVPQSIAGFPPHYYSTPVRRTALEDFLTRRIADQIEQISRYDGRGLSRRHLQVAAPGQKILPRTALMLTEEYVEVRIYVLLPQRDGRIDGERVKEIFFDELATVVTSSLVYCNLPEAEVSRFVDVMEDADQIRQLLPTQGLISFIAEGAYVDRLAGSDYPDYDRMQPLVVDPELITEMEVPNAGTLRGLGLSSGVTLILGDDYSGRVALLNAIAAGIYNHIPGDGREWVITVPDAVQINAEPGRSIQKVDISAFIRALPGGVRVEEYSTEGADASLSQAAALVESLEIGARALLFDESLSAPAFLSRDSRLTGLMAEAAANLAPLSTRARQLIDDLGISLVVAGSVSVAEFIPVADTVLYIHNHRIMDITARAKKMDMSQLQTQSEPANLNALVEKNRWIVPTSIDSSAGHQDQVIEVESVDLLKFGRSLINLQGVSQLADKHQTATIGLILYYAKLRYMDEGRPIREIMDLIDRDLGTEGLECLSRDLRGDLARPRRYEIAAALNRLSAMRVSHVE